MHLTLHNGATKRQQLLGLAGSTWSMRMLRKQHAYRTTVTGMNMSEEVWGGGDEDGSGVTAPCMKGW